MMTSAQMEVCEAWGRGSYSFPIRRTEAGWVITIEPDSPWALLGPSPERTFVTRDEAVKFFDLLCIHKFRDWSYGLEAANA